MTASTDAAQDWRAPGTFEVAPGVYRIPMPMSGTGLSTVNVYAITGPEGITLIDAGEDTPTALPTLASGLAAIGAGLGDITRVLVTHVHLDHYGLAPALRRSTGAEIVLGAQERVSMGLILDPEVSAWQPQRAQLIRSGAEDVLDAALGDLDDPRHGHATAGYEPPDSWLDGPAEIPLGDRVLDVIPTPGHTVGHLVYALPGDGVEFTGDHILPRITPSIGFDAASARLPLQNYLDSLERIRSLPNRCLLPSHGPVTDDVHGRVAELLEHHRIRLDQTADAVREGATTAREVAARLPWTRRQRPFTDLSPFDRMLAVCETLAHLDVLAECGEIAAHDDGPVTRFG